MRRAPARPVRACFVRSCCLVAVQKYDLRATPVQCNAKRTISSHFTSARLTPCTAHFTLHTSCTSPFTLHLHSSDPASQIISYHVSSSHLSSSHLTPFLLTCHLSKFSSTVLISSDHWSTFLISSRFFSTHLSSSARQKALTVREKSFALK